MPTPAVAQVTAALKPTAVNAILAEVRELKRNGRDVVSLMRGEPDLPTPDHIVAACQQALADGLVVQQGRKWRGIARCIHSERLALSNSKSFWTAFSTRTI